MNDDDEEDEVFDSRQEAEEYIAEIKNNWMRVTSRTVAGDTPQQPPPSGGNKKTGWKLKREKRKKRII